MELFNAVFLMFLTYLSVTIDQRLSWNQYISNISNKANSTRGQLPAMKYKFMSNFSQGNILCVNAMVRSVLEYTSSVWSPSTKHNISKL